MVIDTIRLSRRFAILGIIDNNQNIDKVLGIRRIGNDNDLRRVFKKGCRYAFVAIGSVGDSSLRKAIADNLTSIGFCLPVLYHPSAVISKHTSIGEGTFIAAGSVINAGTKIGRQVIINTASSIDHDCSIGDFAHIAPGVTLSGAVNVGEETHIGTGAKVIQGINIGRKCLVAAGSIIYRDIPDGTKHIPGSCE